MKPFPEGQMYGRYQGDDVTVIGVPDDIGDMQGEALIFFHSPLHTQYGKRKTVKWGEVHDIHGPAVENR